MNQLPRVALVILLLSALAVMLPHAFHLPVVFWPAVLLVFGWRWLMHLGRLPYPGKKTKVAVVLIACSGIALTFGGQFMLESAVAFFFAMTLLKVMEMKARRDGYVVVFLCYFLLATAFLFEQGMLLAAWGVVGVWLATTALVSLHLDGMMVSGWRVASRYSMAVLAVSLPVMLVLFLFFPRMTPLWTFTLQSAQGYTGLSNSMTPGDIASLSQQSELAFRVSFESGQVPPRNQLYWRALVLDRYDGRSWSFRKYSQAVQWQHYNPQVDDSRPGAIRYDVIQEPTGQNWLFTLRNGIATERYFGISETGLLMRRRPVYQRIRYQGIAWPNEPLQQAHMDMLQYNLRLPEEVNPRTRRWVEQLALQHGEPRELVNAMLANFARENYHYTLKPDVLGANDIDEFLFDTRRGFCAHYAGALVFAARVAGIPARVVTGYQGGEWNQQEGYLTVRQYDAHAWTELWFEGEGWVRIDPTAWVSPLRIEQGLEAAVASEGSFLEGQGLSPLRFKSVGWINRMRLEWESLNYLWSSWVLAYDNERQKSILSRWLDAGDWRTMLSWMAGLIGLAMAIIGLLLLWNRRGPRQDRLLLQWQHLQSQAAAGGITAPAGVSPRQLLEMIAVRWPELAVAANELANQFDRTLYYELPDQLDQRRMRQQLRRRIRRFERQLARSRRPGAKAAAASDIDKRPVRA